MPYVNGKWQAPSAEDASKDMNAYKQLYGSDLTGQGWLKSPDKVNYDLNQAQKAAAEAASQQQAAYAQQQAAYAQQQAAQQAAYERQAQLLQQQYERQKAAEEAARQKQEAAALAGRDALVGAAQGNYDASITARQEAYDKNVDTVNSDTERAMQQAYINNQLQKRNLGQQLAALGRSGGAAESTLLGLANEYGGQRGTLDEQRNDQLGELALDLSQGKAEDLQRLNDLKAQYESDYQNRMQDLAAASLERLLNYDNNYTNAMASLEQARAQQLAEIASAATGYSSGIDTTAQDYLKNLQMVYDGTMTRDDVLNNKSAIVRSYGQELYNDLLEDAAIIQRLT